MNAFIRLLYAALIAIAVVVFVGVGVSAVYPGPKMPEYPNMSFTSDITKDPEAQKKQTDYDKQYKAYEEKRKAHSENVAKITAGLAVVIVLAGLYYMRRDELIGEGVTLGGVATSIHAIVSAETAEDRVMRLVSVTIFLVATLAIVQRRFGAEKKQVKVSKKK